ncbi:vacuolar protein sorting protein [Reticulomyxa filosa]|uniref:Vacuolar protein sorting protein n=1 Tax=Reticulomyxa filosa TaxID=46433 RepID=X6N7Y0_RETFI|nr:vacuolar protein sorting protein [Reticulomyxa filosa]|eukprot:ETO22171.1 vacuolar protein sorting protein [Reticulomyxa filosa]
MLAIVTDDWNTLICSGTPSTVMEKIDIESYSLVTHNYFPDPMNSEQLVLSYANSVEIIHGVEQGGQDNKLLLLGTNMIGQIELLSWDDRVSTLVQESQWIKALCLVLQFYEELRQSKVIITPSVKRLAGRMEELIIEYAGCALKDIKTDNDLYLVGSIAMDYCVSTQQMNLLFGQIFTQMKEAGGREIFLQLLESYILFNRVNTIPTEVMEMLIDFLVSKQRAVEAEKVILHLSWEQFNLDQLVKVCRQNQFFVALCYINNEVFEEFATPALDMFYTFIQPNEQSFSTLKEMEIVQQKSFLLLLYFHVVLNEKSFPWKRPLERPTKAKQQIISVLFDKPREYVLLRHLFSVSLQCTLDIIKIIFDDPYLFSLSTSFKSLHSTTNNSSSTSNTSELSTMVLFLFYFICFVSVLKDLLSNAQFAVMKSAKWAMKLSGNVSSEDSTSIGNRDQSNENQSFKPTGANSSYEPDPSLATPTRQDMFNVLVELLQSGDTLVVGKDKVFNFFFFYKSERDRKEISGK